MASKNPVNEIAARIALDRGYDPCQRFLDDDIFWRNKNECDPDFVPDPDNGYCYKVLSTESNFDDGVNDCILNSDAELVEFNSNSEVNGLIKLIETGKCTF